MRSHDSSCRLGFQGARVSSKGVRGVGGVLVEIWRDLCAKKSFRCQARQSSKGTQRHLFVPENLIFSFFRSFIGTQVSRSGRLARVPYSNGRRRPPCGGRGGATHIAPASWPLHALRRPVLLGAARRARGQRLLDCVVSAESPPVLILVVSGSSTSPRSQSAAILCINPASPVSLPVSSRAHSLTHPPPAVPLTVHDIADGEPFSGTTATTAHGSRGGATSTS